jgi:hypothetical protein
MRWAFWKSAPSPEGNQDRSLIATVGRIERELSAQSSALQSQSTALAAHSAAFREYVLTTDVRLELIDVLTTKVLPQLSRVLSDSAESNRVLAASQAKLNDTFERVLSAIPSHSTNGSHPDRPVQLARETEF